MMAATTTGATDPLQRRRWLSGQTEWIASGSRATDLGRRARRAYLDRNQVRNLQRVAETSAVVTTLVDYIKTQIGKHPLWRRENFGPMLLDELDRLRTRVDASGPAGAYAELCRLYVRQLAASYLYSIAVDATAPRPTPPARPATPPHAARPPRQRGQRAAPPPEQGAEPESASSDDPADGAAATDDAVDVTTSGAEPLPAVEQDAGTDAEPASLLTDTEPQPGTTAEEPASMEGRHEAAATSQGEGQ
jgi:hypothetical protein